MIRPLYPTALVTGAVCLAARRPRAAALAGLLPKDGPTGGFFRDRRPLDW